MRFRGELKLNGKTATGIRVPDEVVTALGGGKRPAVAVTLNGYTYRTTVAPMGGEYWIGVRAEIREAARVAAGETHDIDIALDTAPREIAVPDDLAAALAEHPQARAFFDGLSYTNRSTYVSWVEDAKKPETRAQRVEKSVAALRAGQVRR
jgi:hypothetical protein